MPDPWKWGFTPGEKRASLLICAAILIGIGYQVCQRHSVPQALPLTSEDSLGLAAIRTASAGDTTKAANTVNPELAGLLDLNQATCEQLEALPGIGQTLARRIVILRDSLGGFKTADDLTAVPGIGSKRLTLIRPLITISP